MSNNETMTTSATGGMKAANDERYDLIPPEPLRLLAKHYGVGANKYDGHQWRKGYEWSKSFAAMMRHAQQFWAGEDVDAETGSPHMAAVAWHAFTLLEFMATMPEHDDRFVPPVDVASRWAVLMSAWLPSLVPTEPRVVPFLTDEHRGSQWTDSDGDCWRHSDSRWEWTDNFGVSWQGGDGLITPGDEYGPFTEILA